MALLFPVTHKNIAFYDHSYNKSYTNIQQLLSIYYICLQEVEREISFRTESGLYYSYYKQMVNAPSITQGGFSVFVQCTCFCVVLCVSFCTGHFVINLTYLHCLQHSLFDYLFIYIRSLIIQHYFEGLVQNFCNLLYCYKK